MGRAATFHMGEIAYWVKRGLSTVRAVWTRGEAARIQFNIASCGYPTGRRGNIVSRGGTP